MGDGEMAEGNVWEAAAFAGHYGLDNLVAMADVNALGQSERTMYQHDTEVYRRKFESQGWAAEVVDGHDMAAVVGGARSRPCDARTPLRHYCAHRKGPRRQLPCRQGRLARQAAFRRATGKSACGNGAGAARPHCAKTTADPTRAIRCRCRPDFPAPAAPDYKLGQTVATREAYGIGLKNLAAVNPKVYAVDGDVKNSTFSETLQKAFPDRLIQGYIAEQNMVSVAVGMAAQGLVPFVDTFACFLSRAYDQVRMAAISRSNIKLCGSHCGVSIGEDGPSQMALEDLAMFRAIPGAAVFYPTDARLRRTADRRGGAPRRESATCARRGRRRRCFMRRTRNFRCRA